MNNSVIYYVLSDNRPKLKSYDLVTVQLCLILFQIEYFTVRSDAD